MTATVANDPSPTSSSSGTQAGGVVDDLLLQRVVLPEKDAPLELLGIYVRNTREGVSGIEPVDRTTLRVQPGTRASFDLFFNAFPAGYYRRWTHLREVELRLSVQGAGRVDVYQSSGRGRVLYHSGQVFDGESRLSFRLPLAGHFTDGGFYWFTVSASDEVTVSGSWHACEPLEVRPATIGICTFNRPVECLNTLATLAADPDALTRLAGVVVVDQGDKQVHDQPGYADVAAAWGGRLRVVPQRNLGGSGGFSRAMFEVLQGETAGDVLLMDDDIVPEPESVLRATAFAAASSGSVLVHGHMLDLWSRTHLHNTGDLVDTRDFSPRAVDKEVQDIDLTETPLAETPELHRRFDSQFGGWWMCLVPREALAELGLSLPIFIKWDDIEYGLRAAEEGWPTVTVPGVGVWHMPFHAKDVNSDWTAYFECRNRLLVALLYGDDAAVRGTVLANFRSVVKALVSLNYSAVELHHLGIEDLLRGPEFVFADLPEVAGRVRAARAGFPDAQTLAEPPAHFESTLDAIAVEALSSPPTNWVRGRLNIVLGVAHALASAAGAAGSRRADLTSREPRWPVLARLDEALVSTADGSAISLRVRDNAAMRSMLARAVVDHTRVLRGAAELRRTYRSHLAQITAPDRWSELFR